MKQNEKIKLTDKEKHKLFPNPTPISDVYLSRKDYENLFYGYHLLFHKPFNQTLIPLLIGNGINLHELAQNAHMSFMQVINDLRNDDMGINKFELYQKAMYPIMKRKGLTNHE